MVVVRAEHCFSVRGNTVADGNQAVDAVLVLNPDVLIIDISMPVLDGLHAAARLQKANCRTKIIFLTIHEGQEYVAAALHVGASGYVTKSRLAADLVPAIRAALQGRTLVSQTVSGQVSPVSAINPLTRFCSPL